MSHTELANINGAISPIDDARISVTDHGFLYGDGVYETIRTYDGRPFLMKKHLERLSRSASAIHLELTWSDAHLTEETRRTLAQTDRPAGSELAIRIMVTRGNGPFGYDPKLTPEPNLVILVRTLTLPTTAQREQGVPVVLTEIRRNPIEALDPRVKSSNLLNVILAAQDATRVGAYEAVLFNTSGHLSECTQSNIFFVSNERLRTPSLDCGLLGGLTRDLVLEIASEASIACEEGRYPRESLFSADEVFLTSSTREILPITRLDGTPVASGRRGLVTEQLQDTYSQRVEQFFASDGV